MSGVEVSWLLESFCKDYITALGIALDLAIRDRHEYEAGFNATMDMLLGSNGVGKIPRGVPPEDRPQMLADVKDYAKAAGIPYNKLSPLNQFMVTIPPYVFYCLENYLLLWTTMPPLRVKMGPPSTPIKFTPINASGLQEEARRLMNTKGFPRYLQEELGYPISQEIKGAFWRPNPLGWLARLFGFGRRN
jgi:hypothetical protein